MSGRLKELRRETIRAKSPLRNHSMNQESTSWTYQGEIRLRKIPPKIERSVRRKRQAIIEIGIFSLSRFKEGVQSLRLGLGTAEDSRYVSAHLDSFDRTVAGDPDTASVIVDLSK